VARAVGGNPRRRGEDRWFTVAMTALDRPDSYGQQWADVYDDEFRSMDPGAAVALLAELADTHPALELGIGTGRIAIPLAARGVDVRGVDASAAMVARLREKRAGDAIAVEMGDMASMPLGGPYGLVFVVFNTLFALLTQERQVALFGNVAAALEPDGRFVVECFVPDVTRFRDGGQTVRIDGWDDARVRLHASVHDPVGQTVRSHVLVVENGRAWTRPVAVRYCWPAELDLMARLAGLELEDRWSGWEREPFTASSHRHVSVYRRL
jgi:SAM-dependent methyltransferase